MVRCVISYCCIIQRQHISTCTACSSSSSSSDEQLCYSSHLDGSSGRVCAGTTRQRVVSASPVTAGNRLLLSSSSSSSSGILLHVSRAPVEFPLFSRFFGGDTRRDSWSGRHRGRCQFRPLRCLSFGFHIHLSASIWPIEALLWQVWLPRVVIRAAVHVRKAVIATVSIKSTIENVEVDGGQVGIREIVLWLHYLQRAASACPKFAAGR